MVIRKLLSRKGVFSQKEFGVALIIVSALVIFEVVLAAFIRVRTGIADAGGQTWPLIDFLLSACGLALFLGLPYVLTVSVIKRLRDMGRPGWASALLWAFFLLIMFAHAQWVTTGFPVFRLGVLVSFACLLTFLGWLVFAKSSVNQDNFAGTTPPAS